MKRYGYIFEKVCDLENIKAAIYKAARGKKHRRAVRRILDNADTAALRIKELLESGNYKPSPTTKFLIRSGTHKKEREIQRPAFFPDQIIHWALMLQIEKYIVKNAYNFSCGSMPGKGVHYAKRYICRWLRTDRKNTKYCLKLDIKKFYQNIDREALKTSFARKFKDKRLLELIAAIIDSDGQGIPIGNYTSQWFANFFLSPLDHFIKQELKVKYYVRYMDDMVLLGRNKKELHKIRKIIAEFISPYGIELRSNWQVFRVDKRDIDFLGFRFFRNKTTLRKRIALNIRRRVKKIYKKEQATYKDACAVISSLGWIKHTDSHYFFVTYIAPYINIKQLKEVIRRESRKQHLTRCTV